MAGSTTTDDLIRDLQATLNARRDLGTAYDDHFIESFIEKLEATTASSVRKEMASPSLGAPRTVEERARIAIGSLAIVTALFAIVVLSAPFSPAMGVNDVSFVSLLLAFTILGYNLYLAVRSTSSTTWT